MISPCPAPEYGWSAGADGRESPWPSKRPARGADINRHEAALVIVGVEERLMLKAVNDIEHIVDVEPHSLGRRSNSSTATVRPAHR